MKNFKFLMLCVLATSFLFMVGCNKDEMNNLPNEIAPSIEKPVLEDTPTGDIEDITDAFKTSVDEATSRGANVLIYSATTDVAKSNWRLYRYSQSALLPGYKYTAVITPLSGDPDLYIYGYDAQDETPWRLIRQSNTTIVDVASLSNHELETEEEAGYFAIYGYTNAKFSIKIYRENVCGTEDCIGFNNNKVTYRQDGSQYLITDGISRMLIAPNKPEAAQIVRILKHYKLNRQCFVGRPGASFTHYTRNGFPPVGAISGEDCISFNPNTIQVKEVGGRWKIVDGNHWMFDFDKNKEEAEETFCIIKKHGYTKSCFVGRPNPSLQYMRK